jgi:hypothetical protein
VRDSNPNQGGFDFGDSNFEADVFSVFDMSKFPEVSAEDVANKLRCKGEYALRVWRKAIQVYTDVLDEEIVNDLRQHDCIKPLSIERMALVLNESENELQCDIDDAIKSLAIAIRMDLRDAA